MRKLIKRCLKKSLFLDCMQLEFNIDESLNGTATNSTFMQSYFSIVAIDFVYR